MDSARNNSISIIIIIVVVVAFVQCFETQGGPSCRSCIMWPSPNKTSHKSKLSISPRIPKLSAGALVFKVVHISKYPKCDLTLILWERVTYDHHWVPSKLALLTCFRRQTDGSHARCVTDTVDTLWITSSNISRSLHTHIFLTVSGRVPDFSNTLSIPYVTPGQNTAFISYNYYYWSVGAVFCSQTDSLRFGPMWF